MQIFLFFPLLENDYLSYAMLGHNPNHCHVDRYIGNPEQNLYGLKTSWEFIKRYRTKTIQKQRIRTRKQRKVTSLLNTTTKRKWDVSA